MIITEVLNNGLSFEAMDSIDNFCKKNEGKGIKLELTVPRIRTGAQNNALHLWFEQVAVDLNAVGVPLIIQIGTKKVEREWTERDVKYNIFHPTMETITGKDSTSKLDKIEVGQCIDPIREWLLGWRIEAPFPSEEGLKKTLINFN